jgi:S-adenosylmethionine:tRNA ribosyltransferase-isomerase
MALRIEELAEREPETFTLPPELEAREPVESSGRSREDVRLLVTSGASGAPTHAGFADIGNFLAPGDRIVLNASATVPSRLRAHAHDGSPFDLHVSTRLLGGICVVEAREHKPQPGEVAMLDGGATVTFLRRHRNSNRLWAARLGGTDDVIAYLFRWGRPIAYRHVRGNWPIQTYQTVYASEAGSAEMPSAGRPFTQAILKGLTECGIRISRIVLHTGVSSPERDEPPYEEQFCVPANAAAEIAQTRASGGRIIAVGTTVVRAIESATDDRARIAGTAGWTDLVITAQRRLRFVDGMITGFHEPRSSHLAMLEAVAGKIHVRRAYDEAIAGRYLWHEFGDTHLLLP